MMTRLGALSLSILFCACGKEPTALADTGPSVPALSVIGADPLVGAIVLNEGAASDPFVRTCRFAGRVTTDVVMVRNPTGGGLLTCSWSPWPTTSEFDRAFRASGFNCFLNFFGSTTTNDSNFVVAMNGDASMTCRFHEIPTPPTPECYGQIVNGIASTWPWAHDDQVAFPPPPGSLQLWIETFGPAIGVSTVHELQLLFCGT